MFWLVVSSVCWTAFPSCPNGWPETQCFQTVQISTVPVVAKEGQKIYYGWDWYELIKTTWSAEDDEWHKVTGAPCKEDEQRLKDASERDRKSQPYKER